MDDSTECSLSRFAGDTKSEGEWSTHHVFGAIQRNLGRLEKWLDGNLMKFNKRDCKFLHLGRNNGRDTLGDNCVEGFVQEDLGGPDGHQAQCEPAMCPSRKGCHRILGAA